MASKITLLVLGLLAMAVLIPSHGEAMESTETSPIFTTVSTRYDKCDKSSIQISQAPTTPIGGIPTYTAEISNTCVDDGCIISNIHVDCAMFSSATLISPRIFKRLKYNDCLVNGGNPIGSGRVVSFKYANTFSYPLVVTSAHVICH